MSLFNTPITSYACRIAGHTFYAEDDGAQTYITICIDDRGGIDVLNSHDYGTGERLTGWDTGREFKRWLRESARTYIRELPYM